MTMCKFVIVCFSMLAFAVEACMPKVQGPPVPSPPAPSVYAADCATIYRQELNREPDPEGLTGCENQIALAASEGKTPPQEAFRAFVRTTSEWLARQETLKVVVLPRLVVRNAHFFGLETGEHWYGIEATDFNLYGRFLNGEDIAPILAQRRDVGFNSLRVFTHYDIDPRFGIGRLRLDEHPDLYSSLSRFIQAAARSGFYLDLVAYTGPYTMGFDPQHWLKLCQAIQESPNVGSVLLSLVNEVDQAANALNASQFEPCPGVLSSRGSRGGGQWPPRPIGQWTEYHSNGQSEWWRKVGHEPYEMSNEFNMPVHATENVRFPDQDSTVRHACDAGGTSALLNAAATFHSVHGKNSTLWEGIELQAAQAWARCAREVPLSCQDLPYTLLNRGEPNAGARRVYTRGGSSACTRETSKS